VLQGFFANIVILAQYAQSNSEPVVVPRLPRGPPQKPKQSGHALWVGNLHPTTNIANLKDHFSRDATSEIQSLFLISKSNCAFVNYRSELACVAALDRFNGSRLHGARLVCVPSEKRFHNPIRHICGRWESQACSYLKLYTGAGGNKS
jgi:RNA recognition motif-containing protein